MGHGVWKIDLGSIAIRLEAIATSNKKLLVAISYG